MKAHRVVVFAVGAWLCSSALALADGSGWPGWARMPNRCEKAKMFGDPVVTGSSVPFSAKWDDDVSVATPRGQFVLTRTFVGDRRALGQTYEASPETACREPIIGLTRPGYLKAPYGNNFALNSHGVVSQLTIHSLTSIVDTRCSTHTRILTPDGDVRFFAPPPPLLANGDQAWVPRSQDGQGEPSRLRTSKDSTGHISYTWFAEDGRRFDYVSLFAATGPNGQYRLKAGYRSDGALLFEVQYGYPSSSSVPGQSGLPALKSDGGTKWYWMEPVRYACSSCPTGMACSVGGVCVNQCPDQQATCSVNGTHYCADLNWDSQNCGQCGAGCSAGAGRYCGNGACLPNPGACDASLEPISVTFPETEIRLEFVYKNPPSKLVAGTEHTNRECVLDRVEAVLGPKRQELVSYGYQDVLHSGPSATSLLLGAVFASDGGANAYVKIQSESYGAGRLWSTGFLYSRSPEPTQFGSGPLNLTAGSSELTVAHRWLPDFPASTQDELRILEEPDSLSASAHFVRRELGTGCANCCSGDTYARTIEVRRSFSSSGKDVNMSYFEGASVFWDGGVHWNAIYGPLPAKVSEVCVGGQYGAFDCAEGSEEFVYGQAALTSGEAEANACGDTSRPVVRVAQKGKGGAFARWTTSLNSSTAAFETTREVAGALSVLGDGALKESSSVYDYGSGGQQVLVAESAASALDPLDRSVTRFRRDGNGRIAAVIRSGRTVADGAIREKHIAVFYGARKRPCTRMDEGDSQRIVSVIGPCEVESPLDDECRDYVVAGGGVTLSQQPPVVEYYYYGSDLPTLLKSERTEEALDAFNSGRLEFAVTYANGCDAPSVVGFGGYSANGDPGWIRDANGRTTTLQREGGLLTSMTLPNGASYVMEWDRGRVSRLTRPEGDSTVVCTEASDLTSTDPRCYRTSIPPSLCGVVPPGNSCPSVSPSANGLHRNPHWVADVGRPPGLLTVRSSLFSYDRDFVTSQDLRGSDWESFIRLNAEADIEGRSVRTSTGADDSRFWTSSSRRDSESSLTASGTGLDFVAALDPLHVEPHCAYPTGDDPRCTYFTRDRLGRLVGTQWRLDETEDCLAYDAKGNISVVAQGCPSQGDSSACIANAPTTVSDGVVNGGPSCGERLEYVWDDFGRIVSFRRKMNGGWATTTFEHYPSGAVSKRQTTTQQLSGEVSLFAADSLGRPTEQGLARSGTWLSLTSQSWDSAPALPEGCEWTSSSSVNTIGRLAYSQDPVWRTWYAYDELGRVATEKRVLNGSAGDDACANEHAANGANATSYTYTPNGNVGLITYPFGRRVQYKYSSDGLSDNNLPIGVAIDFFPQSLDRRMLDVLTDIEWTPDKRVRAYTFVNYTDVLDLDGPPAASAIISSRSRVSYDYGASAMGERPPSCQKEIEGADKTGRLRRIRVQKVDEQGTLGTTLYERWYTWAADQIVAIDVCYEDQSTPLNELRVPIEEVASGPFRQFDQHERLLSNQVLPYASEAYPSILARAYSYDARGNRVAEEWWGPNPGGWVSTFTEGSLLLRQGPSNDKSVEVSNNRGHTTFTYDADGRQTSKRAAVDSSGFPNGAAYYHFPDSAQQAGGGTDSVLRSVELEGPHHDLLTVGLIYNYFYDATNRRTRKVYPSGASEDFFYDLNKRLISERSFMWTDDDSVVDEYVYLGGLPVLMIRADFGKEGTFGRRGDFTGWCARRGVDGVCGMTQIVSEYQGRPVLALDMNLAVVGVGEYDAFGTRNRVRLSGAESSHPMMLASEEVLASGLGRAQAGSLDVMFRARASFFDAEAPPGQWVGAGKLEVRDSAGAVVSYVEGRAPHLLSPMLRGSEFSVVLVPDGAIGGDGAVLDGYDYERLSPATWVSYFPPLRFPGHYYDEETDLHENWNRYQDSVLNRYLSPEPLLQSPSYIRLMAQGGMSVPTYAYAANNPLRYADSTGREIEIIGNTGAQIAGGWALGEMLANPKLGNITALVMMDPLNKIGIGITDGLGLEEYGGGRTAPPSNRANGGLYCETRQSMDAHRAWAADPRWHDGLPLDPRLPLLDWTSMIAHEFGHGVAYIYDQPNKPAALFFENAIRATQGSPPRTSHQWPTAPFWGPAR